jgi:hypothetical protein
MSVQTSFPPRLDHRRPSQCPHPTRTTQRQILDFPVKAMSIFGRTDDDRACEPNNPILLVFSTSTSG